jgi:peptide/nickel transport system ATP-binding protein
MYAGRIVEMGPVAEVVKRPRHPYTQGLLASTIHGSMRGSRINAIPGAPPDMSAPPPGCSFAPRCPHVEERCRRELPEIVALGATHGARCVRLTADAALA